MLWRAYHSLNEQRLAKNYNFGKFAQRTASSGIHKNTWLIYSSPDQYPDGVSLIISPRSFSWKIIPCICKRRNRVATDISIGKNVSKDFSRRSTRLSIIFLIYILLLSLLFYKLFNWNTHIINNNNTTYNNNIANNIDITYNRLSIISNN